MRLQSDTVVGGAKAPAREKTSGRILPFRCADGLTRLTTLNSELSTAVDSLLLLVSNRECPRLSHNHAWMAMGS